MKGAGRVIVRYGVPLILGSAGLMAFLSQWEDGRTRQATVYLDPIAKVPTACNGITAATSPVPVVVGDYWSEAKCKQIARLVVENTQLSLLDCLERPVPQEVFDALSSHAHNFGVAQTCASRAVGLINAGRMEEGCDAIANGPDGAPVWSYVNGTYVRGLYRRRLAERQMCMRGVYQHRAPS